MGIAHHYLLGPEWSLGASQVARNTESQAAQKDLRGEAREKSTSGGVLNPYVVACGFAEHDSHAPLPMVQELEKILKPCRVRYRFNVHPGAEHGYSLPDRDVHDKRATERDWELIFAMLHRQIPPHTA